jgi:hypothetical protein
LGGARFSDIEQVEFCCKTKAQCHFEGVAGRDKNIIRMRKLNTVMVLGRETTVADATFQFIPISFCHGRNMKHATIIPHLCLHDSLRCEAQEYCYHISCNVLMKNPIPDLTLVPYCRIFRQRLLAAQEANPTEDPSISMFSLLREGQLTRMEAAKLFLQICGRCFCCATVNKSASMKLMRFACRTEHLPWKSSVP